MLHVIHWLKNDASTAAYRNMIDFDNVGVTGYSMGARQALDIAANAKAVQTYSIKAAVAMMPHCTHGCPMSLVPTFYFAGTEDTICPAGAIEDEFLLRMRQDYQPMMFKKVAGAMHHECSPIGGNRYLKEAIHMMRCYLDKDARSCAVVKATACNGGRTSDCTQLSNNWPDMSPDAKRFRRSNFQAVLGCPRKRRGKQPVKARNPFKTAAVRCCRKGKCQNVRCYKDQTWLEAKRICENLGNGISLCPAKTFLKHKCCGRGCGFDTEYIWTSDRA
mmetsp:Transcript_84716/g.240160  ORF Transcript_84716/g.240160 Transcript_84716/m.240160 type:complete len:275 (+) Transcript_84716:541-1365(+)